MAVVSSSGDVSLLAEVAAGNTGAFWQLWEAHRLRLHAICLFEMHGNGADAQDALGDAMLRAFDKLPRCAARITSLERWLVRLTRNVCIDIHRRRARGQRAAAELELRGARYDAFDETAGAASDAALAYEHDVPLASLIARLPDRLREVFVLRVLGNVPYDEVARRLQLTSANARKRVQQARAALRAMLRADVQIHKTGEARLWSDSPNSRSS